MTMTEPSQEEAILDVDHDESGAGMIGKLFAVLILSALLPAYVHVIYVIGRWSWNLIGG